VKKGLYSKKEHDDSEDEQSGDSDNGVDQVKSNFAVEGEDEAASGNESAEDKATLEEKFGQKAINKEDELLERLREIQVNFYNRLESNRQVKKTGKIPFTEHMTVTHEKAVVVPEQLAVNEDIKREVAFYNLTRENVMKGMQFLVQTGLPISRPDDFLAEMLKTDEHMARVKGRLLTQQTKIKAFEEKKHRGENKKFHKAIKEFKMKAKHKEKRENLEAIGKLKKKIKETGGDMGDDDFDKIMGSQSKHNQGKRRENVIDQVKESMQQRQKKKS